MIALSIFSMILLPPADTPPNVILILADDIGVDRIGCYGDAEAHTPVIDGLAAQGARFTSAYSETVCSPSRAALLTGTYPHRYGISNAIDVTGTAPEDMLPLDAPSLPAALPAEYTAEAIGKWHLSNESVGLTHPLLMGFAHHSGTKANPGDVFEFNWFVDAVKINLIPIQGYVLSYSIDKAIQRINAQNGPYVMYIALHAPHKPLHVPPWQLHTYPTPLGTPTLQYRAYTEAMDTEIGRLLSSVDLTNTYVIFMGDNGTIVEAIDPSLPPEQSKGYVYEGGIHVPLIISGPNVIPGDRTGLTHIVDLAPTIAALTGGDGSSFQDGRDISDALFLDPEAGRNSAYWKRIAPEWEQDALRVGRWKVVRDLLTGESQLFDLLTDPGETTDMGPSHPIVLERMLDIFTE